MPMPYQTVQPAVRRRQPIVPTEVPGISAVMQPDPLQPAVGTTGGIVPAQQSELDARASLHNATQSDPVAGISALMPQPIRAGTTTTRPELAPGALAPLGGNNLMGLGGGGRGGSGGAPGASLPPALDAAVGISALREQYNAQRDYNQFVAPYIPTPGMAPEAAASRFGYLEKLAAREVAPDAGISAVGVYQPVAGAGGGFDLVQRTAPGQTEFDRNRSTVRAAADAGISALSVYGRPGALGYESIEIPGVGTAVRDKATGTLVESSKITRPTGTAAAGGPEISADGNFFRSGPNDEWKPRPASATKDPAQMTFETNLDVAQQKIGQFRDLVKQYGNFESLAGNPKAQAELGQLNYQLAVLTAKIVDPTSVAREGEVAAAQKYLIPTGLKTRNSVTLAALDNMEQTFRQYSEARGRAMGGGSSEATPAPRTQTAKPGAPANSVPEYADAAAVQAAVAKDPSLAGKLVRVNGALFRVRQTAAK